MPFDKVADLCLTEEYETLAEHDQLTKERNENNIFSDFNEGGLNFRPTYRRIRNDDTWSYKKNQSPSWCDRVLFRTKPNSYLELLEYGSREQQYGRFIFYFFLYISIIHFLIIEISAIIDLLLPNLN